MSGLLLALVLTAASPAPLRLAVPGFTFVNLDSKLGEVYLDRFVNVLGEQGVAATTPRDVAAVIGLERQKALLGCNDSGGCAAELAGALGVDAILQGSLAKSATGYTVNLRVLRASTGVPIATASARLASEGALQDWLDTQARELPPRLRAELGMAPLPLADATPAASPGVSPVVRWLPAMVGALAIAGAGVSLSRSYDAAAQLRSGTLTLRGQGDARSAGALEQNLAIAGFSVGGALIATSLVWAFISRDAPKPAVSLAPTPGGVMVGYSASLP
jgi:hypothetical protein